MQKWEYSVLPVVWDSDKKDYYLATRSKGRVYDLEEICNYYGEVGWELISVTVGLSADVGMGLHAEGYHLFFKRPKS